MLSDDHFNYPSANRNDTMYLSTLSNQDTGLQKRTFQRERQSNLDITDIDKAKPYYQGYQYTQKESFNNRNDDIEGSKPKKLHQPLEKVYYGLRNDDIAGTKPQSHKFVTTRMPTNPLVPEYKVPQVEIRQPSPPRFIRDNIDIKDIDGAKPNPYTKYNIQRKTNNVEDIDGAKPKKEWIPQGKQNALDVRDINYFWEYHTKRQTDPLSPRYKVVDEDNKLVDYGQLDNKAIVRHPKEVNKVTSSDLRTEDIIGAQAGTSVQHVNKLATRENHMNTQDIPGAQTTTLKKGMSTTRQSNPLWPSYKVPGHSEPPPVYNKNLGNSQKIGTNTTSDFGANTNSGFKSQADEAWKHHNRLVNPASTEGFADNRNVRDIVATTPPPIKASTGFARSGEEVLGGSKSFSGKAEYVPARTIGESEHIGKPVYQSSSKPSYVPSNAGAGEKKDFKPLSYVEKFDKYIK